MKNKIKSSFVEEINTDEFVPKQFVSSSKIKELRMKNIVININAGTIHIPQIGQILDTSNSIFHSSVCNKTLLLNVKMCSSMNEYVKFVFDAY